MRLRQWRTTEAVLALLVLLLGAGTARAQSPVWPADANWLVLTRAGVPITDGAKDESGAQGSRDVVGATSPVAPTLYISSDANFIYYRMRIDGDPVKKLSPLQYNEFAWACEMDTNQNINNYEFISGVDGKENVVELSQNTTVAMPNSPKDPAETVLASWPPSTHSRGVLAPSTVGGDADYFIDWAVPRAALMAAGITDSTPLRLICGTSPSTKSIDGDLISPTMSTTLSDLITDPVKCNNGGCVSCNTASACGPSCGPCGGGTPTCNPTTFMCVPGCTTDPQCGGATPACKVATNTCVPCTTNAHCTSPTAPICNTTTNTCGPCTMDPQCGGATPACKVATGACVACTSNTQCTSPTAPICNTTTNTCGPCTLDPQCGGATPACKVATGACVACTSNTQCTSPTAPICNTTTNTCGPCTLDSQCPMGAPVCQPNGSCGQCSMTDSSRCMGATPVCNVAMGTCVPCTMDPQCPMNAPACQANGSCGQCSATNGAACAGTTPVCNTSTGTCAPCTVDTQCPMGAPACQANGSCGQCSMNNATACTGGTLCNTTMGRCVACLNNSQCGGTTPLCDTTVGNCVACRGDGAPSCTDPAKPACQMTGALAGSCTECTSSTSCSGTRPICLTATGTCGCTDTDGDDECGGPTSGLVCSGPAGTCVPGCSTAANRNTCGTGQACSNTSGGVGSCIQGCANDNDCPTDPLRRCDSGQAPARCVQCLVDGQCASPLVCAETTTRTCVECTPTKTAACTAAGNGAACLTSGVCGCTSDFDCGTATSGRVCNTSLSRCVPGCRGSGGNTCAPNQTCTSSTNAIGSCQVVVVVPPPMPDAGVDMGTVVVVPPTDAAVDLPAPDRPVVVPDAPLVDMPLLLPPMVDAPMAAVDAPSTPTDTLQPPRASDAMRTSDALSMGEPDAMTGTISMPGMVDTVVDAAVARDMMAAPALPAGMDADPPATVPMDDGFIAGGGCGCRTAGAPSRAPAGASYLFAAVAVLLARRRRR